MYMVDRPGLLHDGLDGMTPAQQTLAQPRERVASWGSSASHEISLLDTVRGARATVLVGVSGQPKTFTEEVVRLMSEHAARPIIFPLSNPTSRIEATPADLLAWSQGKALVATGSPFSPVEYDGRSYPIAQCNNAYVFPGMGLGVLASGARRVTDGMFMAAAEALSCESPALKDPSGTLLPPLREVRIASKQIAYAVAARAQADGVADTTTQEETRARVDARVWTPSYPSLRKRKRGTHGH